MSHENLVPVLEDLAQMHTGLGDHLAARRTIQRIHSIRARSPFPDPNARAFDLVSLSHSHRQLHDLARADDLARQALDMARRHLKERDPGLVGYLEQLGRTCQARRAFSAAQRHFNEGLELVRKTGGDRHPLIAGLWTALADLEVSRGKPRRATRLYTQAADLLQTVLGEDHPDHAAALRTLGQHFQTLGENARSEDALRRHLVIVQRTCGPEHPAVALAYQALSDLQRQGGDLAGAIASCRQALNLVRRTEFPIDAIHAHLLHSLAVLYRQQGRLDEAASLLGNTLEIDHTSTGEEGAGHLASMLELARIEGARGENASAFRRINRVVAFQDEHTAVFAHLPPSPTRDALLTRPWTLIESLLTLALLLPDAAEPALAGVLRWKGLGPSHLTPGDRAVSAPPSPVPCTRCGSTVRLECETRCPLDSRCGIGRLADSPRLAPSLAGGAAGPRVSLSRDRAETGMAPAFAGRRYSKLAAGPAYRCCVHRISSVSTI